MGWFKKAIGVGAGIVGGAVGFVASGGNPAGAAAGFAIGSAIGGAVTGAEAASKEKKAAKAQQRQAQLQSWQASMDSLREYQVAQAMSSTSFQGSGASLESSGAQGVRSSLGATEASNQNLLGQNVQLANDYYRNMKDAAEWRQIGAIGSAVSSIGSSIMSVVPENPGTSVSSGPPRRYSAGGRGRAPSIGKT